MSNRDALIERIRKILVRTEEAGCTEAEAAAAMAKVQQLLLEHHISMAEIEAAGSEPDVYELDQNSASYAWDYRHDFASLILTKHYMVKCLLSNSKASGKLRRKLMIFGDRSSIDTARFVFSALVGSFDRLWREYRMKDPYVCASEKRAFCAGVMKGYSDKLTLERKAFEVEQSMKSPGTELVLASAETRLANKFNEHPMVRGSGSRGINLGGGGDALAAGYQAGKELNINRSIGGGAGAPASQTSTRGALPA